MGGLGSGGRPSFATTLGDFRRVDMRYLRRNGCLQPGHGGSLRWSRRGHEVGSSRYFVELQPPQDLWLIYRVRDGDASDWEDVTERLPIVRTAQPFGGERRWLVCSDCGRHCLVVYGGRRFRCRRCVVAPYES